MKVLLIHKTTFNTIQLDNVSTISYANGAYTINGVSYSKADYNISILW